MYILIFLGMICKILEMLVRIQLVTPGLKCNFKNHGVVQTKPVGRLDSSLEWEPIREGKNLVKLRTRYGNFLRANGGLPPWRNSVTHDIPHRTATQDWISWEVDVVEFVDGSPHPNAHAGRVDPVQDFDSFSSSDSSMSHSFGRQESSDSLVNSPPKTVGGRTIYYHIADTYGKVDETAKELFITFKGNGVEELTKKLEEETGIENIVVCSCSPLNNKLYPLRLQLPPNNATMHVVIVESSSKAGREFAKNREFIMKSACLLRLFTILYNSQHLALETVLSEP